MLDRKTDDKDASIELLEDRINLAKKLQFFVYIVGFVVFIIALSTYFYTGLVGMTTIILFLALFVLIGFYHIGAYKERLGLLIYLKKHLEKEEE